MKVTELLNRTASGKPVPGGGSIAALSAAAAAGLVEMVANLTIGKPGYEAVQEKMEDLSKEAHALREKLTADIDNDSDAYNRVYLAFKLPRQTEEEKQNRQQAIQDGLRNAASVPMSVAENAYCVLKLAGKAIATGNKNAVTDGAVGAMMARTAVLAALCNVKVNLGGIKDESFAKEMKEKINRLETVALREEKAILCMVDP